jgi:predicted O-methyltransferase YrrM
MAFLFDGIRGANLAGLHLLMKDVTLAREYWSQSLRRYDELVGRGLECADPVEFVYAQGWATRSGAERVLMPAVLGTAGGTRLEELVVLATVARVLKPARVFEIGTFMGRTTSAFALNVPEESDVVTLDLPQESADEERLAVNYIDSDVVLVKQRRVGSFLDELGLRGAVTQLFGDSMQFDPAPYAGSVELGFIDGAHARPYVENDTQKMAVMMSDRGLVFWHDYGGKGRFRGLTEYLDGLARSIPLHRVVNTTLAWAAASDLRRLLISRAG